MNLNKPRNFAITGVAGYVAPRHLKAIQAVGGELKAALDPHDSVGILDSCFPDCRFFTEHERFDRHLEKLTRSLEQERVHCVIVCSPNYLHDAHIRTAFRVGADVICEKPLVLNPWNLDMLEKLEAEAGCRVWNVLQLRLHPSIKALKRRLEATRPSTKHKVVLTYVTPRGEWYLHSWKGQINKSGGIATNIGIHFFDILSWLFGSSEKTEVHVADERTCSGTLELERASVQWFLTIDANALPERKKTEVQRAYRSITIDGEEVEFSTGSADLYTELYHQVLSGDGFGIAEARPSIEITRAIRVSEPIGVRPNSHPFLKRP